MQQIEILKYYNENINMFEQQLFRAERPEIYFQAKEWDRVRNQAKLLQIMKCVMNDEKIAERANQQIMDYLRSVYDFNDLTVI